MSKTLKPLKILVDESLLNCPEVQELMAQGHSIEWFTPNGADLLLGPIMWRMTSQLIPWLGLAVKEAQQKKYSKSDPIPDTT